jgi:transposase, IS5 family
MDQLTFAEAEYNVKKRKTRREKFLEQMDILMPWKQFERRIQRHYPKNGQGRQPYPLKVMLRVHCMQLFTISAILRWRIRCTKLNPCVDSQV